MNQFDIKSLVSDIASQAQTGPALTGSGLQKNSLSPHFERFVQQRVRSLMIQLAEDTSIRVMQELNQSISSLSGEPEKIQEFASLLYARVNEQIAKMYSNELFN